MDRRINVDEVDEKDISIRISGNDVQFAATGYSVTIYINEDEADRISFHLQSILQDRELKRKEKA